MKQDRRCVQLGNAPKWEFLVLKLQFLWKCRELQKTNSIRCERICQRQEQKYFAIGSSLTMIFFKAIIRLWFKKCYRNLMGLVFSWEIRIHFKNPICASHYLTVSKLKSYVNEGNILWIRVLSLRKTNWIHICYATMLIVFCFTSLSFDVRIVPDI